MSRNGTCPAFTGGPRAPGPSPAAAAEEQRPGLTDTRHPAREGREHRPVSPGGSSPARPCRCRGCPPRPGAGRPRPGRGRCPSEPIPSRGGPPTRRAANRFVFARTTTTTAVSIPAALIGRSRPAAGCRRPVRQEANVEAVIVATARRQIRHAQRGLAVELRPNDLGTTMVPALLAKAEAVDPGEVEDVIWAAPAAAGRTTTSARVAALQTGSRARPASPSTAAAPRRSRPCG